MWKRLKSLLSNASHGVSSTRPERSGELVSNARYTQRMGQVTMADEVFDAWTSGELAAMLKALKKKTNLIDRHFLLMGIVNQSYKSRKDPKMRELCREISERHVQEFDRIAPALKKDMNGVLPRVSTFQQYAKLLSEDSEDERAIEVCERTMSFGLTDGTQSGFEGRVGRTRKKMLVGGRDGTRTARIESLHSKELRIITGRETSICQLAQSERRSGANPRIGNHGRPPSCL